MFVRDNDEAGLYIDQVGGETEVVESYVDGTYQVHLTTMPIAPVIVNLSLSLRSAGQLAITEQSLTFDSSNWFTAQTVHISPVEDFEAEGHHTATIIQQLTSADPDYNGLQEKVDVTIYDRASVIITESNGSTFVILGADDPDDKDTYTVVLSSPPAAQGEIEMWLNDFDIEGGDLDLDSINILSGPAHGTVAFVVDKYIYTPTNPSYVGVDSFTYESVMWMVLVQQRLSKS